MGKFYIRWLRTALSHSVGPIDLWTGVVGAVLGIVDHFWPQAQLMTTYGWQIVIWVFGLVLFMRFFLAPYWMWQADQVIQAKADRGAGASIRQLIAQQEYASALREQTEAFERDRREADRIQNARAKVREELALLIREARDLETQCRGEEKPPIAEIGQWTARTTEYLRETLGEDYVARFEDITNFDLEATRLPPGPGRHYSGGLFSKIEHLLAFIKELQ